MQYLTMDSSVKNILYNSLKSANGLTFCFDTH